jgi:hypothetical protein
VTRPRRPCKQFPITTRVALGAALSTALVTTAVWAIEDGVIEIERIDGDGWNAEGVVVRFDLSGAGTQAHAAVARLQLDGQPRELRNVRVDCPQVELSGERFACRNARVTVALPALGPQSLTGSVAYGRTDGSLELELGGLNVGRGTVSVRGALRNSGWSAQARLSEVAIEPLTKLARDFSVELPDLTVTDGRTTLTLDAAGAGAIIERLNVAGNVVDFSANNTAGSLATDKLSLALSGTLRRSGDDWQFQAELRSSRGQAYAEPMFLDLGLHEAFATARGRLRNGGATIEVQQFELQHEEVVTASGSTTLDFAQGQPVRSLALRLASLQFPGAYQSYLQPFLLDTDLKSLKTSGGIAGELTVENGAPQHIDLKFDAMTFDDDAGKLALHALDGSWSWSVEADRRDEDETASREAGAPRSRLAWRSGKLFGLELGAGELQFSTSARDFRLLEPARIPVFDGVVELDSFRIRNVGMPTVAFIVDATIRPISVQRLCRAFGWPEFGGQIGGAISKLRMREGVLTLGTTLTAQVFDGGLTISDLRLEQPLGQWPRFYSNVAFDNLDLELLTGAFSFGRITGRISGGLEGLQLFNWTPVAFDARLYTTPDDRSRHRISQRAVQNIGSIGGGSGAAAALSSGFLRFFEDFNYDRLGWSCRLQNEVCAMDGVAPAPNGGYYLVKGKGVPRIDVIGNSRRVDWPRLVQQLIAATKSGGPVVE